MPRGSDTLAAARREEILDACAQLYEQKPFREITLGEIGEKTSFTRTSIYNYFRTKEEIFLALLEREYRIWIVGLEELTKAFPLSAAAFSKRFAAALEERRCMLKLMSMNLYDMESGSRMENLVAFKRTYGESIQAVERCLKKHFSAAAEDDLQRFLSSLFPFLLGVYPYAVATEKQKEAMRIAGVRYERRTIREVVQPFVEGLVQGFRRDAPS